MRIGVWTGPQRENKILQAKKKEKSNLKHIARGLKIRQESFSFNALMHTDENTASKGGLARVPGDTGEVECCAEQHTTVHPPSSAGCTFSSRTNLEQIGFSLTGGMQPQHHMQGSA